MPLICRTAAACPLRLRHQIPASLFVPCIHFSMLPGALYGRAPMAASLVTLGSPHGSIEQYPFGRAAESLQGGPELAAVPPAARTSSLQFANHYYPSSSAFPGLRLTCVCGDAVVGRPLRLPWRSYSGASSSGSSGGGDGSGGNATDDRSISVDVSTSSGGSRGSDKLTALDYWFCYESYKSGCGRGDVPGKRLASEGLAAAQLQLQLSGLRSAGALKLPSALLSHLGNTG